jgi:hypothetical protein
MKIHKVSVNSVNSEQLSEAPDPSVKPISSHQFFPATEDNIARSLKGVLAACHDDTSKARVNYMSYMEDLRDALNELDSLRRQIDKY